jgi:eukaryotic-like serine/threonine-protein kinase
MRFAILVKTTKASEAGEMPGEDSLADVVTYHEELARAGALYDATGLHPTREGWRIRYSRGTRTVVEGPFEQANEQIAGWTVIDVASREEAMGWAMRFPRPSNREEDEGEIEVRQLFELKDFVQGPAIERFRALGSIERIAVDVEHDRPDLSSATAPNGTATILFTDIEGSTELTERLGDREWMALLAEHNEIVRAQAAEHSGFEVKSQGDGFMLAFASALDALRCAIGIQRALAGRDTGPELRVRIGLHTGEPVREADDFYGKAVVLAARIASEARGSEILVSSLLRELTESSGEFAFEAPTDAQLKGLSGTYRLSAVRWMS